MIYTTDLGVMRETNGILAPCYRFWVEVTPGLMDEDFRPQAEGLKAYAQFYVPAVDGKYIENMPVWGGEGE